MDNFTWIKIHILRMIGSLGFYKSDVHGVHIFFDISENANYAKICTARKHIHSQYSPGDIRTRLCSL